MAITLTTINVNDPVANGPATINGNFSTIKQHIDDIENLLNPANGKLQLTSQTTIANNSIECAAITLTAATGNVLVVSPNGGTATVTLTATGALSLLNVVATGTGADKSSFGDADFTGAVNFNSDTKAKGKLLLNDANTQIANKYRVAVLADTNMGSGATAPLDISKDQLVYLDYDNSGNPLAGSGQLKLDTTNLLDGQILKLHCYRDNASGMALYNGTTGNEVFAFIDPNGTGYTSIAAASCPEFAPSSSPNNQSWLVVQWTNIGSGTFRLVVLDSKLVNNVN